MLVEILIVLLVLCVIAIIAGTIVIFRQSNKIDFYEKFIAEMQGTINKSYLNMKSVDVLGSFEADDEIGDSFRMIKQLLTELNELVQ